MTVDTAHAMVAELLTSFTTRDGLRRKQDRQYRRLVDALWIRVTPPASRNGGARDHRVPVPGQGRRTPRRLPGDPARRAGRGEFPETDGELYVAVRAGVRTYVD